MIELLKILIAEQQLSLDRIETSFERLTRFPQIHNKIRVAVGMRRVGKSVFLLQQLRRLMVEEKIPKQRLLYLNFEDDRLLPCSQEKFRALLEGFYQIYPENHDHTCHLFLDEVQNVEDWSLVVRRFFDTKKVQLYLSGSSAKLLSTEIATELRGRSITTEIWPYSFQEYLMNSNVGLQGDLLGQRNKDVLLKQLSDYLENGGFPETLTTEKIDKRQILQDYVELVIMRDIVERYSIKNISLIKYMIQTLLKTTACGFSVNKFFNDVKSQGMSASRSLLYDYLNYIEDAYLTFSILLFDESLRKTQTNPRKIYAIDPGLVKAFSFSQNKNSGHLFENIFFLDLKRQGHKIYYYQTSEKYEVDFLAEDRLGNRKLYQVVWNIEDKKTLERETRALEAAEKELQIKGQLITPQVYIETLWENL